MHEFPPSFIAAAEKGEKEDVLCMPHSICILKANALEKIMKMQRAFVNVYLFMTF